MGGGWQGGVRGAKRAGNGGPVWNCCYAALRTWRSYINTIRAVCARSDGECDQNFAGKVGYFAEKVEILVEKKRVLQAEEHVHGLRVGRAQRHTARDSSHSTHSSMPLTGQSLLEPPSRKSHI
jgi:hypothetical protein